MQKYEIFDYSLSNYSFFSKTLANFVKNLRAARYQAAITQIVIWKT